MTSGRREPTSTSTRPDPSTGGERSPWRSVAIPSEHGGWGLTGEPILLGLLLAFSWAGAAVGAAALLAFLMRTPLKLALVDRRRNRSLDRTRLAWRVALGELSVLVVLGAVALWAAGWEWLLPVAIAAPLVGIELWFDIRSRSRRLIPELCGTVGIASVAAAIVVAGDGETRLAIAAWLILAGRGLASVPFVRTQIQRLHRGEASLGSTDLFQLLGALLALSAIALESAVVAGSVAVVLLAVAQAAWLRRPAAPPMVTGYRQMAFGFAVVGATAASVALLA